MHCGYDAVIKYFRAHKTVHSVSYLRHYENQMLSNGAVAFQTSHVDFRCTRTITHAHTLQHRYSSSTATSEQGGDLYRVFSDASSQSLKCNWYLVLTRATGILSGMSEKLHTYALRREGNHQQERKGVGLHNPEWRKGEGKEIKLEAKEMKGGKKRKENYNKCTKKQ